MSKLEYFVIDAFTATAFKGNSAAVVLLNRSSPLPDTTLQSIAAEFNLAETAFVTPIDASRGRFGLRWFTPMTEFPLCGHATLATASVLFSARTGTGSHLPETVKEVKFETLSGILTARSLPGGRVELELPASEATAVQTDLKKKVERAVLRALHQDSQLNVIFAGEGRGVPFVKYLLVEVDGVDLKTASVDSGALADLCPQYEAIILTRRGHDEGTAFTSRVFFPRENISEDPVCGSAHCMLGPYWATRLQKGGSQELVGMQVSPRSGEVRVVWDCDRGICRLRGETRLFAKGELYLPA